MATAERGTTIAALATAPGAAGVSIVRVSGDEAHAVLRRLCPSLPEPIEPRRLYLARVCDPRSGTVIDEALVVAFEAGASFTGERVAEIHGHGGLAQSRALVDAVLAAGARAAGPGEFTRRALASGRIDLARAEGLAEVVAATSDAGLAAARSLMGGALSRFVEARLETVEALLADWEAALDFPDDAEDAGAGAGWPAELAALAEALEGLARTHARGRRLRDGARVVLVGPPNAGKSSLLNALVGYEKAIVDAEPGTTRDVVEATVDLCGIAVTLVDGAGLRAEPGRVEAAGVARIEAAVASADLCLVVADGSVAPGEALAPVVRAAGARRRVVVANKTDLGDAGHADLGVRLDAPVHPVSARTGEGVAALGETLGRTLGGAPVGEGEVVVTLARHQAGLEAAAEAAREAERLVAGGVGLDAASEELREARRCLSEVLGRGAQPDALLDRIFARFCIGK